MAMGIDESLNMIINNWYYFALLFLMILLYKWYDELKKFKKQYIHWVQDRQDNIVKKEQKFNPSIIYKWIVKMHPFSDKGKIIGKIKTYSEEPTKANPGGKEVLCRISANTSNLLKLVWWKPMSFSFMKGDVFIDEKKGVIKIPANYFWERNWDGTMILISPKIAEVQEWVDDKMYKDLHEVAIDGYATQMASYSSVKPTWGHEERIVEKEGEGKALGFGGFLKKKKKKEED